MEREDSMAIVPIQWLWETHITVAALDQSIHSDSHPLEFVAISRETAEPEMWHPTLSE
jgi:hypothetical protein